MRFLVPLVKLLGAGVCIYFSLGALYAVVVNDISAAIVPCVMSGVMACLLIGSV